MADHPVRIYAGPSRYVQGRGALLMLGDQIKSFGIEGKALIVVSKTADKATRPLWEKSLKDAGLPYSVYIFGGECSDVEIAKIKKECEAAKADYLIAIGGGKDLDAARAAAEQLKLETIICPSIASTDAPCIAFSVIYKESGEMQEFRALRKNPLLVLVDTDVIVKAPKRFLVAGMGDALSTYYEAKAAKTSCTLTPKGGLQTEAGLVLAKLCRDILLADGAHVVANYDSGAITPAFERVVEANVLLSGMGVELCHVAGAHAIHNGLTQLKETHHCYHGEKVAFGIITQLILEGDNFEEIDELLKLYHQIGLPSTFKELGIENPTDEMLFTVAERALLPQETMSHEPFIITAQDIVDAMRFADSLGQQVKT